MEKDKIKVVHILQSAGGVAEYLKDLLKYMDKECFENIVIGSHDYMNQNEIIYNCEKIFYVDMIREINVKKDFKSVLKIKNILNKEKPDVVYLHSSKAGALGRIALLFNRKTKIIYNAHGWYFNADIGKKKKYLFKIIEKILSFRTNKIIAISKSEYDSAIENHICKKDKLILIENAIDIKKYEDYNEYREETRKKYKIDNDKIIVGVVGRISEQKDPITTIEAAEKVIKNNKNVYFMFVGSGELEETIVNYAKEKNISSNIIITGWVNNVKEYISAFDIAVLPSKWEGFGLAILEYMICKKPIITTGVGGISDILDKPNNALFIKKENSQELATQILNIVNRKIDMSDEIKENYEKCKSRFNIKRLVAETEETLEEITNNKGGVADDKK